MAQQMQDDSRPAAVLIPGNDREFLISMEREKSAGGSGKTVHPDKWTGTSPAVISRDSS